MGNDQLVEISQLVLVGRICAFIYQTPHGVAPFSNPPNHRDPYGAEYSDDPHVPAIWRAGSQALVCANKFNLKTGPPRTGGGTEKALFTAT